MYDLEWSCPGEPYGFDSRSPGAACPNPKYNKPEERVVDRYGLEWSCPGEPYGFDPCSPGSAYARTPSTKSHATSSRAASIARSSAQDSVTSKLATTSRQPRNTERATRKRPGQ